MQGRLAAAAWLVALGALGAAVAGAAAAAAVGARAEDESRHPFDLGEVLNGTYSARGLGGVWVSENQIARRASNGNIELVNVDTNATQTLVLNSELTGRNQNVGTWTLSRDLTKLLWSYDVQAGFRHSTEAKYSVYIIQTRSWKDLHSASRLQTAQLAPSGNGVAYVYNNDVYHVEDINQMATSNPITRDGTQYIYNGVPDWVYEEEVLSSGSAMWFSPNGSYLVHAKFNDTEVDLFTYMTYGIGQYPKPETLLYPKPGRKNPTVQLFITKVPEISTKVLPVPNNDEIILQNVAWAGNDVVVVTWLNRIQNKVDISNYTLPASNTAVNWTQNSVYTDTESSGWFDVGTPQAVNNTAWVVLLPIKLSSDDQRFMRPTVFVNGKQTDIVNAKLTATALYGWDTVRKRIFFQAAPAGQPAQRHVYSAPDGSLPCLNCVLQCLSCDLVQPYNGGTSCLYASASFSRDFSRAAFTCSGPGPAAVRLATVSSTGSVSWMHYWETNSELIEKLDKRTLPTVVSNISVEIEGGVIAQARMWLPPDLDKSKKYPMLVYVYGGPGSQQVSEAFSINWGTHLATAHNIIYASIDGRGSGLQGSKTLYALYKKLGTVEVLDQINVTKALLKNHTYIDPQRVGIWGWSYGGYATAMALARDTEEVFACGASVAPVTSWDLYDSIYTERYMDTPQINPTGYKNANISDKIANFKNHDFYLLHGNADDNVHYQQAMRLARALEEGNIFFETQSYPDENHSIRSVVQHVYMSLTVFFERCFEPKDSKGGAPMTAVLPALLPALAFPLLARFLT